MEWREHLALGGPGGCLHFRVRCVFVDFEVCTWGLGTQCGGDGLGALPAPGVLVALAFQLDDFLDHGEGLIIQSYFKVKYR